MSTAIEFNNISKQYRLGVVSGGTIRADFQRWWQMNIRHQEDPFLKVGETNDRASKGSSEYVWALKDIDFKVEQGDVVGIIGKNGAGKSTLLKILSKVTGPTTGTIRAKGRIGSLLEVGTGFHPEMTGRENIYLNGAILGMSKPEIKRKLDEIVDFSGCERYIDTPVKRYSSGMMVRLGFAVAAHLDPEILVVDEVLAVGDAEFQKKAIGKMQDVSKGEGRTVLFVSHNMGSIQKLCKTGVVLENGTISYLGNVNDAIDRYLLQSNIESSYQSEKLGALYVKQIILSDGNFQRNSFYCSESINIDVDVHIEKNIPETFCLLTILDRFKRKVFSAEKLVEEHLRLEINPQFLTRGTYSVQAIIYKPAICQYDFVEDTCAFTVVDDGTNFSHLDTFDYGSVFGSYSWKG